MNQRSIPPPPSDDPLWAELGLVLNDDDVVTVLSPKPDRLAIFALIFMLQAVLLLLAAILLSAVGEALDPILWWIMGEFLVGAVSVLSVGIYGEIVMARERHLRELTRRNDDSIKEMAR